jgi:hypothetical protein
MTGKSEGSKMSIEAKAIWFTSSIPDADQLEGAMRTGSERGHQFPGASVPMDLVRFVRAARRAMSGVPDATSALRRDRAFGAQHHRDRPPN